MASKRKNLSFASAVNMSKVYVCLLTVLRLVRYQEFGVYDQTNVTAEVPLVYIPTIYNIQYSVVTSFEFHGTTFYNYHPYEAPVLSYPVYDYIPEVYDYIPDDFQYGDNTSFIDVTHDAMFSPLYYDQFSSSVSDSMYNHLSTDSANYISYHVSQSDYYTTSIPYPNSFNNIISEYNNSYLHQNNVSYTEPSSSSSNSFLTLNENTVTDYRNDPQPNNEDENILPFKNEDTDFQNGDDTYSKISFVNTKHDANDSNKSTEFEQTVDINENELNEHWDNYSSITQESKVLDWTVEVENDDLEKEEEEGDDDGDDKDDAPKVNFSTLSDIDPYYSTEVVKYFKEELYRYALSGHMSLKKSTPVVDVLPIIEENSESVENDDIFERTAEVSENREGSTRSVIEDDILPNVTFDVSEQFIENHDFELENENEDQGKTKTTNATKKDKKFFPIFNVSQQNVSNNILHREKRHEVVNTDHKRSIHETEDIPTQLSLVEESEILLENVAKLAEIDIVFNASSEMNQSEEKNQANLQINVTEGIVSIGDSSCTNADSLLKSVKNVENINKVTSNPVQKKRVHDITFHVPNEDKSHNHHDSEAKVEKGMEREEKVSNQRERKKFQNFRKWFSNLLCCVRKKT